MDDAQAGHAAETSQGHQLTVLLASPHNFAIYHLQRLSWRSD